MNFLKINIIILILSSSAIGLAGGYQRQQNSSETFTAVKVVSAGLIPTLALQDSNGINVTFSCDYVSVVNWTPAIQWRFVRDANDWGEWQSAPYLGSKAECQASVNKMYRTVRSGRAVTIVLDESQVSMTDDQGNLLF